MGAEPAIEGRARFRRLSEYLAAKAPLGKLPGRQHIDPVEIADLLPHLMLLDVIPQTIGEPRYRIRLMGTQVVTIEGVDHTGKYIDDVLTGSEGPEVIRRYAEMLRTREPQYRESVVPISGHGHLKYERAAFPLARDGEQVDMLIFVFAGQWEAD